MTTETTTDTTTTGATTGDTSTATSTTAAAATDSTASTETTAGEGQGEAGKEGADTTTEAKADEKVEVPKGAPEAYESFAMPEGFALDGERLEATNALFKDADLSQVQAQKLIEGFIKFRGEDSAVIDGLLEQRLADKITQWGEQSKTEFAGKYDELVVDARAGVAHMAKARPTTLDTFDSEGWGNHPDALAAFAEIGRLARGSSMRGMGGETAGGGEKSFAQRMYPDMK